MRLLWFPVLSSPSGVSWFAALSLFLSVLGIFVAWLVSPSVLFGAALPSPYCLSAFSWLWSDPFSFSSPSLRSVLGGAALRAFLLFHLLVSSRLTLLFCRPILGLLFSAGSVFLPSLPGWSVVFSWVSAALAFLRGQGSSSPGGPCSVPSVCICSAPFLPSSPAPPVSCGLVIVLSPG